MTRNPTATGPRIPDDERIVYMAHPIDSLGLSMIAAGDGGVDWPLWGNFFTGYRWTYYSPSGAFGWSGNRVHSLYLRHVNTHALTSAKFLIVIDPWKSVGASREIQVFSTMKASREIIVCPSEAKPGVEVVPKTPYLLDPGIHTFPSQESAVKYLSSRCASYQGPHSPVPPDPATQD